METDEVTQLGGWSLRDYLAVIRRRKLALLVAIVVLPVAALVLSRHETPLYSSSAQVLLSNQDLANALTGTQQATGVSVPADRVAQTQADLARVPAVARRALATLKSDLSATDLLSHSSVSSKPNADLLVFTVRDTSPARAQRLATAYANAFVRYREILDTASLRHARNEVRNTLQSLPQRTGALYENLVEKDQELATLAALQTSNASLVQPATSAVQVQPRTFLNVMFGLLLGVVLGVVLALLWEALDTRVQDAEAIASSLRLPLLARLREPSSRVRKNGGLALLHEPHGAAAEEIRMLRANLEFVRFEGQYKTLALTSPVAREGKSTTIANLAVAMALSGRDVALVDLDLRRPEVQTFFDPGDRPGLTDVVLGWASIDDALARIEIRAEHPSSTFGNTSLGTRNDQYGHLQASTSASAGSLWVLTAGAIPPNPSELVGSDAVANLLSSLRERFDTVLVDTPPMLEVGDALAVSPHIDCLLVVARLGAVKRPMLAELHRILSVCPTPVLGVVVTGVAGAAGYGTSYDDYVYSNSMKKGRKRAKGVAAATPTPPGEGSAL